LRKIAELKARNQNKTSVELERATMLNCIQFITSPCEIKYMSLD
jgi:hypothetical protein